MCITDLARVFQGHVEVVNDIYIFFISNIEVMSQYYLVLNQCRVFVLNSEYTFTNTIYFCLRVTLSVIETCLVTQQKQQVEGKQTVSNRRQLQFFMVVRLRGTPVLVLGGNGSV